MILVTKTSDQTRVCACFLIAKRSGLFTILKAAKNDRQGTFPMCTIPPANSGRGKFCCCPKYDVRFPFPFSFGHCSLPYLWKIFFRNNNNKTNKK